jgi:hypothetical protein
MDRRARGTYREKVPAGPGLIYDFRIVPDVVSDVVSDIVPN